MFVGFVNIKIGKRVFKIGNLCIVSSQRLALSSVRLR